MPYYQNLLNGSALNQTAPLAGFSERGSPGNSNCRYFEASPRGGLSTSKKSEFGQIGPSWRILEQPFVQPHRNYRINWIFMIRSNMRLGLQQRFRHLYRVGYTSAVVPTRQKLTAICLNSPGSIDLAKGRSISGPPPFHRKAQIRITANQEIASFYPR